MQITCKWIIVHYYYYTLKPTDTKNCNSTCKEHVKSPFSCAILSLFILYPLIFSLRIPNTEKKEENPKKSLYSLVQSVTYCLNQIKEFCQLFPKLLCNFSSPKGELSETVSKQELQRGARLQKMQ